MSDSLQGKKDAQNQNETCGFSLSSAGSSAV